IEVNDTAGEGLTEVNGAARDGRTIDGSSPDAGSGEMGRCIDSVLAGGGQQFASAQEPARTDRREARRRHGELFRHAVDAARTHLPSYPSGRAFSPRLPQACIAASDIRKTFQHACPQAASPSGRSQARGRDSLKRLITMSKFEIVAREDFSPVTYMLEVRHPLMAKAARPGQFVIAMLKEEGERIPLTIADFDRDRGTITLV